MERSGRVAIIVSIALVLIAWQIPYGRLVIYPLSLLGTYVHEMGHGLTALVLGADFERLVMFPDGSGFAEWRGDVGRLARGRSPPAAWSVPRSSEASSWPPRASLGWPGRC